MRMSRLFLRTLRDDPADAEVDSHRLLVRAGYIRKVAAGIYSWLPLGYRVLRRVEEIVRQEMDAAGALAADGPGQGVRAAHVQAHRPEGHRLRPGAHRRGSHHGHGLERVRELP